MAARLFKSLRTEDSSVAIGLAQEALLDDDLRFPRKADFLLEWCLDKMLKCKDADQAALLSSLDTWALLHQLLQKSTANSRTFLDALLARIPTVPVLNTFLRLLPNVKEAAVEQATACFAIVLPIAVRKITVDLLLESFTWCYTSCTKDEHVVLKSRQLVDLVLGECRTALVAAGPAARKKATSHFLSNCLSPYMIYSSDRDAANTEVNRFANELLWDPAHLSKLLNNPTQLQDSDLFQQLKDAQSQSQIPLFLPKLFASFVDGVRKHSSSILSGSASTSKSILEHQSAALLRTSAAHFFRCCLTISNHPDTLLGCCKIVRSEGLYTTDPSCSWISIIGQALFEQTGGVQSTSSELFSLIASIDFTILEPFLHQICEKVDVTSADAHAILSTLREHLGQQRKLPNYLNLLVTCFPKSALPSSERRLLGTQIAQTLDYPQLLELVTSYLDTISDLVEGAPPPAKKRKTDNKQAASSLAAQQCMLDLLCLLLKKGKVPHSDKVAFRELLLASQQAILTDCDPQDPLLLKLVAFLHATIERLSLETDNHQGDVLKSSMDLDVGSLAEKDTAKAAAYQAACIVLERLPAEIDSVALDHILALAEKQGAEARNYRDLLVHHAAGVEGAADEAQIRRLAVVCLDTSSALQSAPVLELARLRVAASAELTRRAVASSTIPEQVALLPVNYLLPSDMQALVDLLRKSHQSTLSNRDSAEAKLVLRLLESSSSNLLSDAAYLKELVKTAASLQRFDLALFKDLVENFVKTAKANSTLLSTLPELYEFAVKIGKSSTSPSQWEVAIIVSNIFAEQLGNATLSANDLEKIKATAQHFIGTAAQKVSRAADASEHGVQICRAWFVVASWLGLDVPQQVSSAASTLLQHTLENPNAVYEIDCVENLRLLSFQLSQTAQTKAVSYTILLAVFLEFAKRHTGEELQQAFAEALAKISADDFISLQASFDMTLADRNDLGDVAGLLQASMAMLNSAPEGSSQACREHLSHVMTWLRTPLMPTETSPHRIAASVAVARWLNQTIVSKASILDRPTVAALLSLTLQVSSGPSDSSLKPSSTSTHDCIEIYTNLIDALSHLTRHRKDCLSSIFPQLTRVTSQLIYLFTRSSLPQTARSKSEEERLSTYPSWLVVASPDTLDRDAARRLSRYLTTFTSKSASSHIRKKSNQPVTLLGPLSKHAPFFLYGYLKYCTDVYPLPAHIRAELAPGLYEWMEVMGKHEREALIGGMLSHEEVAERALLKSMWKVTDARRYKGQ